VYLGHRFYTKNALYGAFLSFITSKNITFPPECHAPNILNMITEHKCENVSFFLACTSMKICSNRCTILSSRRSNSPQPIFTSRTGSCLRNFTTIKSSLSFLVMKAVSLLPSPTHPHFHHSLNLSLSLSSPLFLSSGIRELTHSSSVVAAWHITQLSSIPVLVVQMKAEIGFLILKRWNKLKYFCMSLRIPDLRSN
jgi:hypothetical protein